MANRLPRGRNSEKPMSVTLLSSSASNLTILDLSNNTSTGIAGNTLSQRDMDLLRTLPALSETMKGPRSLNSTSRPTRQDAGPKPPAESDEQIKRRLKLTQTVATQLMKASVDRQPNVFPLFYGTPETCNPYQVDEDRKMRPERKTIISPCIGIAAGVHAMGGYSARCAVSSKAAEQCIQRERESNRVLFTWWESRNAVRLNEEEVNAVEEELRGPVWSCFRQTLTEEEGLQIQALHRAHEELATEMSGRSNGRRGATPPTVTFKVTDRGICLPVGACEKIFEKVMAHTHQRLLTLLRCLAADKKDGVEFSVGSRAQGSQYVQSLLRAQLEMIDTSKGLGPSNKSDNKSIVESATGESKAPSLCSMPVKATPNDDAAEENAFFNRFLPLVSMPEERCFHPLLSAETALASAVLWRILDQSREVFPVMNWALQIFTRYVMPHVYENFNNYEHLFPRAGSLGEQVDHLHTLQLSIIRQRGMVNATKQAKDDLRYMELAMKSWSWRTWRQSLIGRKHRDAVLDRIGDAFRRFHVRLRLQRCFSGWRLSSKEGGFSAQLDFIDKRYSSFLGGAQHAARDVRLFPDLEDGSKDSSAKIVDKHKFIAFKLAETAQHVKGKDSKRKTTIILSSAGSEQKQEQKSVPESQSEKEQVSAEENRKEPRRSVLWSLSGDGTGSERSKKMEEVAVGQQKTEDGVQTERRPTARESFLTSIASMEHEQGASRRLMEFKSNEAPFEETKGLQNRAVDTFEDMLRKLQEMESISGYLRQEIAIQNRLIKKLERENTNLKERAQELESGLLRSEEKQLEFANLLQEKEIETRELEHRIMQLKSRLRCQRHRPWQRTALRIIGEMCGASTSASEHEDDIRIARNMKTPENGKSGNEKAAVPGQAHRNPIKSTGPSTTTLSPLVGGNADGAESDERYGSTSDPIEVPPPSSDEERLFAQLAPIVVSSTRDMPDALTVLRDWANGCLEDLESLDDLKGGALSIRFIQFSDEVRNGVLLSRLLFYLALPRYQNKTALAHKNAGGTQEVKRRGFSTTQDFTDNRRQLLLQHNVQLDSPFPTYTECFGDLLNLKPSGRMSLLLQFATELMDGPEQLGDEQIRKRMARSREAAIKSTDLVPLPPAHRVEMQEIIDAYALARGDRAASVTFIALLYVRFSHPFNHKARQSALIERNAMLYLLSGGVYKHKNGSLNSVNEGPPSSSEGENTNAEVPVEEVNENTTNISWRILSQLEEEECTPWQLFQQHCKPLINTLAHPFILRGNFWPNITFDSPELTRLLGALGLALQRSLQEHRWHITVSCLVPVNTYSGLSRGVFTGLRASPAALQAGLDRDGDWVFVVGMPCVQTMLHDRATAVRAALVSGSAREPTVEWQRDGAIAEAEHEQLMAALGTCGADLLQLFLQRSSLTGSCAMPALDLGSWRMLWIDVGLVNPEETENSLVDLEQISRIFYVVSTALMDRQKEAPRDAVQTVPSDSDTWPTAALPLFCSGIYFPEFLAAIALLAHELFPPLSTHRHRITWLGDAVKSLLFTHVMPHALVDTMKDPTSVLRRITTGAMTQEVLLRHNKALIVVFNSYCKDICGVSGMEREQLMQLLRDAMLTSTDISQNVIFELFAPCSVTKKPEDLNKEEKRREQDAHPRDGVQKRRGNVSILEPNAEHPVSGTKHKEVVVMLYDGFLQFLCVLCHFKQPNPLVPFDQRLDTFLKRGVLRPLAKKNETLSALLAEDRRQTKSSDNA